MAKNVRLEIRVWYDARDGSIRLSSRDPKFISTVMEDSSLRRGHKSLYGHLRRVLEAEGKWPEDA